MAEFAQHSNRIVDGIPLAGGDARIGWILPSRIGSGGDAGAIAALSTRVPRAMVR